MYPKPRLKTGVVGQAASSIPPEDCAETPPLLASCTMQSEKQRQGVTTGACSLLEGTRQSFPPQCWYVWDKHTITSKKLLGDCS